MKRSISPSKLPLLQNEEQTTKATIITEPNDTDFENEIVEMHELPDINDITDINDLNDINDINDINDDINELNENEQNELQEEILLTNDIEQDLIDREYHLIIQV